jgi:ribosomal protein S18 acetylase RimI-like enzyme
MTIVIRRAAMEDVDRVAPLFDGYRGFYGKPSDVPAAREFLAARLSANESIVLIATAGDEVAGFAQLYRSFSSVSLGRVAILNDLFVVPAWRGRGVGARLLDAVERESRERGAIRVELATGKGNDVAHRLYEGRGYVVEREFVQLSLVLR